MKNLIEQYEKNEQVLKGLKEMKLSKEHPNFKVGQIISFYGGYNNNIHFKSKIFGFDEKGRIYILWDCYWFPIKNEPKRKIKILN